MRLDASTGGGRIGGKWMKRKEKEKERRGVPSAEVRRKEAEDSIRQQRSELERRRAEIGNWISAESEWLDVIDSLIAFLPHTASDIAVDRERLIRDPSRADACLDVTVRYEMFLLATHYWEARWLHSSRELISDDRALRSFQRGKNRRDAEKRLRHLAQLTPCFISTLFTFPEHLHYFDRPAAPGAQNAPLTNFIDLLIVDEAMGDFDRPRDSHRTPQFYVRRVSQALRVNRALIQSGTFYKRSTVFDQS